MGSASSEDICSNKKTEEVSAFLIISEQASIDTNRLMRFRVKVLSWATCQKIVCTSTQLPLSSQVCRFHRHADLTFLLRNCFFFSRLEPVGSSHVALLQCMMRYESSSSCNTERRLVAIQTTIAITARGVTVCKLYVR